MPAAAMAPPQTPAAGDPLFDELWHACAGPLVTVPRVGDLVFYFPQGHIEQELIDSTDRRLAARCDRMIQVIDSCLTTGGTPPSSSTSAGSDVCGVAEVPTPASPNPIVEVPTPASSDSDARLVTIDVDGPAAPAWTTRSTGDPSRNTTESSSAPAPATAPSVHKATVDIVPVLAAPAGTDCTLDGQAISGVPSTPTTCSTVCLPRHPVAVPVLVASLKLAPTECVLDTNTIQVAMVPLAVMVEISEVFAPMDSTPVIQLQQLYSVSELFSPSACQRVTNKVPLHRPMPWPSLLDVYPTGDDTRPLPWPSFMEDYGYEALSKTTVKPSQWRSSDSSCAKSCAASNRSYFLDGQANGDETRPLPWPSFSVICDCESPSYAVMKQSWHCSCVSSPATLCDVIKFSVTTFYGTIYGFHWLAMVRRSELKLLMISSKFVTLLIILVDSGNFAVFNCEYLGVDTTPCIGSWLFAGCLLFVCRKSAVLPSTDCYIAILIVAGLGSIVDCHLLGYPCRSVITACLSCPQEHCLYCCSSQRKEIWILHSRRRSNSSYDHFCCAIQDVLCWPGNFVTGINMHTRAASIRRLLLIGYVTVVPFLNLVKVLVQPKKLWQHIAMDFIEGLPQSGPYNCLLVVVDRFSKYGHFIPLAHPYAASKVAALFVDHVYKLHSLLETITSDRDPVFTSHFWRDLFQAIGTELELNSAYHPATDGQTERLNQCVETYLRCFVHACPKKWSSWLALAEYWYNTSHHSTLNSSPFVVLYGHEPRHWGLEAPSPAAPPNLQSWITERRVVHDLLRVHLLRAQQLMKKYADHRTFREFKVGDMVFLKLQPYIQASIAPRANHKLLSGYPSRRYLTKHKRRQRTRRRCTSKGQPSL